METHSLSSNPDSHSSSPRSREIDSDHASLDESLPPKVKFMCSYDGRIRPRSHHHLAYVGGETKILAVDRTIRFLDLLIKLSSLRGSDVCVKYQLPGQDLDALISVTNDEDLEHMMLEYDRLHRSNSKSARLRLFLFELHQHDPTQFSAHDSQQWFVDALNSVKISSPISSFLATPDFLFGFDKPQAPLAEEEFVLKKVEEVGHGGAKTLEEALAAGQSVLSHQTTSFWRAGPPSGGAHASPAGEQSVYIVPPRGMALAGRACPIARPYYGLPGVVPEVYREPPVYRTVLAAEYGGAGGGVYCTPVGDGAPSLLGIDGQPVAPIGEYGTRVGCQQASSKR